MKHAIRTEPQRQAAIEAIQSATLPCTVEIHGGTRTLTQNAALHLWFGWVAKALNDAGADMKRTLRHDADIPWTAASVKEHLWRPVQEAMTGSESTADASRTDYSDVQEALARHIGSRVGVKLPPWPKKQTEDRAA